ncbi:MAG: 4Fe-4S dicluster domain-containing protein [Acutalibacteraceae bacterium]
MQKTAGLIKKRALELLDDGTVTRVLAWSRSEDFIYEVSPTFFDKGNIDKMIYDSFCAANLSKYLIRACKEQTEGKILAVLKPCDTYSFNQLLCEHRIDREKIYVLAVPCTGMIDNDKLKKAGFSGVTKVIDKGDSLDVFTPDGSRSVAKKDVLLEKCLCCKGSEPMAYDEKIETDSKPFEAQDRFACVEKLEKMTPDERFAFWQGELSKCIRCNACRNVCPACSCMKCVFDNPGSGVASKANSDSFEEKLFHIIRAFHVAGRCTDCGECSRVCPQGIPLHLLNRKFIKDIDDIYGEYQAGRDPASRAPLVDYRSEDAEPSIVEERGN